MSDAETEGYGVEFSVRNIDISRLVGSSVVYWVGDGTGERVAGVVTAAKRILGAQDCASDADRGLLDMGQGKPLIRATATLVDPNGDWMLGIMDRVVGWGGVGVWLEKGPDGSKGILHRVSLDLHYGRRPYLCRPILGKG